MVLNVIIIMNDIQKMLCEIILSREAYYLVQQYYTNSIAKLIKIIEMVKRND